MKKIFSLIISLIVCASVFTACGGKYDYTFYVPDGAPVLSVAGMWKNNKKIGGKAIKFELTTGAAIGPSILAKTPDIAIAPINICAQGYNLTSNEYVYVGTAVWGLSYIVARNEDFPHPDPITSLGVLVGETIYAFQKSGTPGLTLKAVIKKQGFDYKELDAADSEPDPVKINIQYLASPVEVRTAMIAGLEGRPKTDFKFGLMTEPVATAVVNNANNKLRRLLDIQSLWGENSYPQAGIIIRKSIIENDPEFVEELIKKLSESAEWAKQNAKDAAIAAKDKILSSELPDALIIEDFIKGTGQNIFGFSKASDCKAAVKEYLSAITNFNNPAIVGGVLPDDNFYMN